MKNKSFIGPVDKFTTLKQKKRAAKRPKYRAMPKAPKMSASLDVWDRYAKKVDEVFKENLKRKNAYERKRKAYEDAKKQREHIKESAKAKIARIKG